MKSAFSLKKVSKIFQTDHRNKFIALKNITLTVASGEFFIILGPSGSGKSTLLRLMSGLEQDFTGLISRNAEIAPEDISFVFQQFALFPWLTVAENIAIGLRARHASEDVIQERVTRELKRLHLEKFAHVYPKELSGGMKQRVGIARALATDPKVIFMDEPFSEIDSFTAEELRQDFLHIWKETHQTIIMVTHLIPEAIELADRIAVLTALPGQVEAIITNTVPRPRNKRAKAFFALEDQLYGLIKP